MKRVAFAVGILLLLAPRAVLSDEEDVAPWHDSAKLEASFVEACAAVEKVCGTPFTKQPRVRLTTTEELREILYRDLKPVLEAAGTKDALESTTVLMGRALLAKYEPATHTVHVVGERLDKSEGAHRADGSGDPDFLRALLAHEATHAHDWDRYGWNRVDVARKGQEAIQAFDAVIEGHAQYVAKRAAGVMGIPGAFDRVTAVILAKPPLAEEALRPLMEVVIATLGFGYVQGHAFVEAVAAAGGEERLEALLREPPTRTRAIEFPDEYLHPRTESETPDLERAVEALRPLVGDEAWSVTTTRLLKAQLAPISLALPEKYREGFVSGVLEGYVLAAQLPAEDRSVVGLLLWFRSPEATKAFLEGDLEAQKAKDETGGVPGLARIEEVRYEDGAGRDGHLPGYVAHKVVSVRGQRIEVTVHSFALGRLAGQILIVSSPEIDRAAQDAALDRLARYLEDPRQAEAEGVFDGPAVALERSSRRLVLVVRDPDGNPVPRARVLLQGESDSQRKGLRDGRAELDIAKTTRAVTVWMAEDEEGQALNLAPAVVEPVPQDRETLEIVMEPGAVIEGRVVDGDGEPVAGVDVAARPGNDDEWQERFGRFAHARAKTGAAGGFRLVGLRPTANYQIGVDDMEDWAPADAVEAQAGATDVTITLEPGTRAVVTVVDGEGNPVAGARLEVTERAEGDGSYSSWTAGTDPQGRARLPALLPDAPYQLEIRPPPTRRDLTRHVDGSWRPASETVELGPGFTVRGVVLDEEGRPVRAVVETRGYEIVQGNTSWYDNDSVRTDAEGRFEIHHLPAGDVRLRAHVLDAFPFSPNEGEYVVATPEKPEVEITLKRPMMLRVRVLDDAGEPVPRAALMLEEGHRGRGGRVRSGAGKVEAPKEEGRLVVYDARGNDGERLPLAPSVVAVKAGQEVVEVRLEPGATIAGRVVGPDGRGVPDARVGWEPVEEESFGPLHGTALNEDERVRTDADGGFRLIGLAHLPYRVNASAEGYADTPLVQVEAGTEDLVLRLVPGQSCRIVVLDPEGRPVSGASIRVCALEKLTPSTTRYREVAEGETDAQGAYVVDGARSDAEYEVTIEPPSRGAVLVGTKERHWKPEDTTIQLDAGYYVTGKVLDAAGNPVVGAELWSSEPVPGPRGWSHEGSRSGGIFRLGPFERGPVRVRACAPGEGEREDGMSRWSPEVSATPEAPDVVLRLPPKALPVRIHVVGAAGVVTVWLRPEREGADDGIGSGTSYATDGEGLLAIESLTPGTYRVFAYQDEGGRVGYLPEVEIRGGEVEVPLVEALAIRVRLEMPEGSRYPEVYVRGPVTVVVAEAEGDGVFVAKGLPPGAWEVHAKVRAPNAWLRKTELVEAGSEVVIELTE